MSRNPYDDSFDNEFGGSFGDFGDFQGDKIDDATFKKTFEQFHGEKLEEEIEPRSLGEVLVVGELNPGIDSIASAIALADLKNTVDITRKYTPAYTGELSKEAKFVLEHFDVKEPAKIDEAKADDKLILVSHNSKEKAIKGAEDAEILEIIDNHALDSLKTKAPLFMRFEPTSTTSTIIYKMFKEDNEGISTQLAGIMCSAILWETDLLRKDTVTQLDKIVTMELAILAGIDLSEYGEKLLSYK